LRFGSIRPSPVTVCGITAHRGNCSSLRWHRLKTSVGITLAVSLLP
jgi:hypothetical protein